LRLREQSLIVRQLAFVLLLQIFVRPRIDLREKIALLHQLAFGETHFRQLAVDLGLHGHGRERCHRAELIEDDAHVAERRSRGADRLQCALRKTAARRRRGSHPAHCLVDGEGKKDEDNNADPDPPPRTRRRLHPGLEWLGDQAAGARRQFLIRSACPLVHILDVILGGDPPDPAISTDLDL
jgi:hypothetical protein